MADTNKPKKRIGFGIVFPLIVVLVGILLLVWGILQIKGNQAIENQGNKAEASISRIDLSKDGKSCTSYITYTVNGQSYTVKYGTSGSTKKWQIGDAVTIWYDSANPSKCVSDITPGIFSWQNVIGVVLILVGILLFWLFAMIRKKVAQLKVKQAEKKEARAQQKALDEQRRAAEAAKKQQEKEAAAAEKAAQKAAKKQGR